MALLALIAAPSLTSAASVGSTSNDDSAPTSFAPVVPGVPLQFPQDFGSHPQFGIEWWYITGWLETADHQPLGFQLTFFRIRPDIQTRNPSDFTAHQLLIAHCALTDPQHGRLWEDQRIRRAGLGLAGARIGDTDVWIDDWSLARHAAAAGAGAQGPAAATYRTQIEATDFALELSFSVTQPPMLNGRDGFSQKGPAERSASYYYSEPHLRVRGYVHRAGRREAVDGEAWLDHEWASEYLDPRAQGWDWAGVNFADGSSLMAFEIRDRSGRRFWGGASLRDAAGHERVFGPDEILFQPMRRWRSPRTGVVYPVAERLQVGSHRWMLEPLIDDQELDSRRTSGALYWEGAVRVAPIATASADTRATQPPAAQPAGAVTGRGYLELTGYDRPLSLR
jgi:predicted secreted hydrolase